MALPAIVDHTWAGKGAGWAGYVAGLEPMLASLRATLVFVDAAKGTGALPSRISAACHAAPLDAAIESPVFVCLVSPRDYWPPRGRDLGVIAVPRGVFGAVLIPAEGGAGLVRADGRRFQRAEVLEHLRDSIASGKALP